MNKARTTVVRKKKSWKSVPRAADGMPQVAVVGVITLR